MPKRPLGIDVFTAARERLRRVYREFERVYVSFSGGKDSGVMVNLAIDVARELGRLPVTLLTIDFEAQYRHTAEFVRRMFDRPETTGHWVCLPIHLRNAVSQFQPHWLCWDPDNREQWVRQMPEHPAVVCDEGRYLFFRRGMEFEEFVPEFGEWFSDGVPTACVVSIRSDESLNRYRTLRNERKETWLGLHWTTKVTEHCWNVYPMYDWRTEDVWIANGREGWDYNRIYDLMYLAGVPLSKQRLCQPYGDDQRQGLYLFKILEPETWARVVARVEGANFGNRYAGKRILGNIKIDLPEGYTYKRYAKFLLATMPPYLADHYREKIWKFLRWWRKNGPERGVTHIPDCADPKLEAARKVPSWRRICKVLLKNDYWCKGLSFSQTKREMERQLALIARYLPEAGNDEGETPGRGDQGVAPRYERCADQRASGCLQ